MGYYSQAETIITYPISYSTVPSVTLGNGGFWSGEWHEESFKAMRDNSTGSLYLSWISAGK